jgi:hypothetical protein
VIVLFESLQPVHPEYLDHEPLIECHFFIKALFMRNLSSYGFFEEGEHVHVDREVQGDLGLVDHSLQVGLGVLETQTQGPQLDEQ